jgi:transcriptional regulator GlxA family with amidase domain
MRAGRNGDLVYTVENPRLVERLRLLDAGGLRGEWPTRGRTHLAAYEPGAIHLLAHVVPDRQIANDRNDRSRSAAGPAPPRHRGGLPGARLKRVLDHISENYASGMRLSRLASLAQMSPHHFSEQFRRSVGISPHQYVMHYRVERAKHLLSDTALGILDVALATGFADQSHFTKVFRRCAHMTPRAFRAERQRVPSA